MSYVGSVFVLLSFAVFLWACVGLFSPHHARLPSRKYSVLVWLVSMVTLGIGANLQEIGTGEPSREPTRPVVSDPPATPPPLSAEEVEERRRQSRERAEEANRRNREEYEARRSSGIAQQSPSGPSGPNAGMASAREWVGRVTAGLGTPMGQIMSQMPGDIQARRSQSGEDRILVWRFRDGSELEMVFRPRGGGQGLELYSADVRD